MNIVFLEPLGISQERLKEKIENKIGTAYNITYFAERCEDTATLIERSRNADIVVLSNIKFGKDVMLHCKNLKKICVAFTGIDHIDTDYCKAHGIEVKNCAGYSTVAVADLVFAMAISLARNVIPCDVRCRNKGTKEGLVGFELEGKTFGIIGMGAIGMRVAKIANAFGCNVIAYSRTVKDIDDVKFVSLDTLLQSSDIVSLHVPQTSETINLIDENKLTIMKPTAFLINTARGPIVNTTALASALKNGTIAGAGIDVFDTEPPIAKDHPLCDAPNTILTPHIAFASEQAFEKRADIVANNLYDWLSV